jgi:hypothetical protein
MNGISDIQYNLKHYSEGNATSSEVVFFTHLRCYHNVTASAVIHIQL